jgi:hypothetical protein
MPANNAINFRTPLPLVFETVVANTAAVTGDGTTYVIDWTSEKYDLDSNFSGTTFTAPYTGKYFVMCHCVVYGIDASYTSALLEIGAVGNKLVSVNNPSSVFRSDGRVRISLNGILVLTVGDTVTASITVSGGALNNGLIGNAGTPDSRLCIFSLNH